MSDTTTVADDRLADTLIYRAVWRWHFYAGLIVLPFVILIAATGAVYLFKDELNDGMYGRYRIVEPQNTAYLVPSQIVAKALEAHGGTLKAYEPPAAADRSAAVKVVGEDGLKDTVYVNPHTGQVLGYLWDGGAAGSPAMWVVRKLHSLEYAGWVGNRIVEAVAGWMILLVATGVYLWWPRSQSGGIVSVRGTPARRVFWRDTHAVTGIFTAAFMVFLAITGLPWSGVWGSKFYELSYAAGLGMPDGYWDNYPVSAQPVVDAVGRAPWIMEKQPMPLSGAASGTPAKLDDVVRTVESLGIAPGYTLNIPGGPADVFTASVYPDDVTEERVIHLDQYSGKVLFDMGLNDLGALGKAAEWGVGIHMGQAFGPANQIILLLACLAMILMSVSAVVMWWKRRPKGSLGAPKSPADWRMPRVILAMAVVAGIFFPLVGLSLLVVVAIELGLYGASRLRRVEA